MTKCKTYKYTIMDLVEGKDRVQELSTTSKRSRSFKSLERTVKRVRTTEKGTLVTYVAPSIEQKEARKERYEKIFKGHTWSRLFDIRCELKNKMPSLLLESDNKEISRVFGKWDIHNKKDLVSFYNSLSARTHRNESSPKKKNLNDYLGEVGVPIVVAGLAGYLSLGGIRIGMSHAGETAIKLAEESEKYAPGYGIAIAATICGITAGACAVMAVKSLVGGIRERRQNLKYESNTKEFYLGTIKHYFQNPKNSEVITLYPRFKGDLEIIEEALPKAKYSVSRIKGLDKRYHNALEVKRKPARKRKKSNS